MRLNLSIITLQEKEHNAAEMLCTQSSCIFSVKLDIICKVNKGEQAYQNKLNLFKN